MAGKRDNFNTSLMKKGEILFILALTLFWSTIFRDPYLDYFTPLFYLYAFFNLIFISSIWYGSKGIINQVNKKISWEKSPVLRLIIEIPLFFMLGVFILIMINIIEMLILQLDKFPPVFWGSAIPKASLTSLLLSSVHEGMYFFKRYTRSRYEAERFEKEMLKSQLDTIHSQISPHFLFNSLSILNTLIRNDQKKEASDFVYNLSDFLRYNLDHSEVKIVGLSEEMEMVEKYIWLLKKRYQDAVIFTVNVPEKVKMCYNLPPLSLQMLVENAIKHNKATEKSPLNIKIQYEPDQNISVMNNVQKSKSQSPARSTQTGLKNIRKWYQILGEKDIRVTLGESYFKVSLPLLNEENESLNC